MLRYQWGWIVFGVVFLISGCSTAGGRHTNRRISELETRVSRLESGSVSQKPIPILPENLDKMEIVTPAEMSLPERKMPKLK
ncbi:MAG: hypothetical protein LBQ54_07955 [Planctomycetaceae bacterium]|nr:hypothetical protein [Planctomycetaceae bacterium]